MSISESQLLEVVKRYHKVDVLNPIKEEFNGYDYTSLNDHILDMIVDELRRLLTVKED